MKNFGTFPPKVVLHASFECPRFLIDLLEIGEKQKILKIQSSTTTIQNVFKLFICHSSTFQNLVFRLDVLYQNNVGVQGLKLINSEIL